MPATRRAPKTAPSSRATASDGGACRASLEDIRVISLRLRTWRPVHHLFRRNASEHIPHGQIVMVTGLLSGRIPRPQPAIFQRDEKVVAQLPDEVGRSDLVFEARGGVLKRDGKIPVARVLLPVGEVEIEIGARFDRKLRPAARGMDSANRGRRTVERARDSKEAVIPAAAPLTERNRLPVESLAAQLDAAAERDDPVAGEGE